MWMNNFLKWKSLVSLLAVMLMILGLTGCAKPANLALGSREVLPALGQPDLLTIGTDQIEFSHSPGRNQKLMKLAEKYEQTILEMGDGGLKENYMESLVEYYDQLGQREQAVAILIQLVESKTSYIAINARKRLARFYYESREFAKGIELLEQVENLEGEALDSETLLLKGDLLCGLGVFEGGKAAYQEALAQAKQRSENVFFIQEQVENRLKQMVIYQDVRGVTVQGSVTLAGQPVSQIRVVMIPSNVDQLGYRSDFDLPQFVEVTDSAGHYSFTDLPVTHYEIYIQLDQSQIGFQYVKMSLNGQVWQEEEIGGEPGEYQFDFALVPPVILKSPRKGGKVTDPHQYFVWKKYPGATSYQIRFNEITRNQAGQVWSRSSISISSEPVEATQLEFDLAKLDQPLMGKSYSSRSLEIAQILGHLYLGAELGWVVEAYDEEGQLLSTSSPQGLPLGEDWYFTIAFGQLQPGDAELIAHKYFAALDCYLDRLEEEPQVAIQEKVWRIIDGMLYMYRYDYQDQFDDAAYLRATQRAFELIPESNLAKILGDLLCDQKRYQEARQVYLQGMELDSKRDQNELQRVLANVEFQLGNYQTAGEYWTMAEASGYQLAYQMLTGQKLDLGQDWQELEKDLDQIAAKLDQSLLKKFRQGMLTGDLEVAEQILQGDTLTARYLHLSWQLISTPRIWDQYELRQKLYTESRELATLMKLSQEEEKAWYQFVGLWI